MKNLKLATLILGIVFRAPAAYAELSIAVESEQKVHGLCELRSEIPVIQGLVDVRVQKKINDILSKDIKSEVVYFLENFETNDFCKEGVGDRITIAMGSYLLSENVISISILTTGHGVHPWYDLTPYNFDPRTAKQYSLTDLVPKEALGWLIERIKQQIEQDKHSKVDDLDALGKRLFEKRLETFFIVRDEIRFDFNTELFGHAVGPTGAEIKLRELAPKLPKNSVLFRLATENVGS